MSEPFMPEYDAAQDPIAETVLRVFMAPMWAEFGQARPDANEVERQAATAIIFTYGLVMVLMARLATRLDTVKPEPSKLGGFLGDFTFAPNPEWDTPEARQEVAQRIKSLGQGPGEDTRPWPGMYL